MTKSESAWILFWRQAPLKAPEAVTTCRELGRAEPRVAVEKGAIRHSDFELPSCLGISSFVIGVQHGCRHGPLSTGPAELPCAR